MKKKKRRNGIPRYLRGSNCVWRRQSLRVQCMEIETWGYPFPKETCFHPTAETPQWGEHMDLCFRAETSWWCGVTAGIKSERKSRSSTGHCQVLPEVAFPPTWMRRDEMICSNLLLWRKAQFYVQTKCFQYSAAKPWLERSQCLLQGNKMFNPLAWEGE